MRAVAGLAVPGQAGGRGQPRPGPGAGAARGAASAAPARPRPAEAQGVRGALPGRLPHEKATQLHVTFLEEGGVPVRTRLQQDPQ